MNQCPACNANALRESSKEKSFVVDGSSVGFRFAFSKCDECGAEVVSEQQSIENKRQKRLAEKHSSGILSGAQIAKLRAKYRLTQTQASQIFGGGPVAFSKYESESVLPSEAMSTLLEVALKFPIVVNYLAARRGFSLPASDLKLILNGQGTVAEKFVMRMNEAEAQTLRMREAVVAADLYALPNLTQEVKFKFSLACAANDELCESAA